MKRILLIVAISLLFAGASVWVWLSRGESAKAVRAKFRLGGALLTLLGLMTTTSCKTSCYDPVVSCYDPAPPIEQGVVPQPEISQQSSYEVRNGDTISLEVMGLKGKIVAVVILDGNEQTLQRSDYGIDKENKMLNHMLQVYDYQGDAYLWFAIVEGSELQMINDSPYLLSIVK